MDAMMAECWRWVTMLVMAEMQHSALTVVHRVAVFDELCGLVSQCLMGCVALWAGVFDGLCGVVSRCLMGCVAL